MHEYAWIGDGNRGAEPFVSIIGPNVNGNWQVLINNSAGLDCDGELHDTAVSAWSTVAYLMTENGATTEDTDAMVAAAPSNLEWCFDSEVGMYCFDPSDDEG